MLQSKLQQLRVYSRALNLIHRLSLREQQDLVRFLSTYRRFGDTSRRKGNQEELIRPYSYLYSRRVPNVRRKLLCFLLQSGCQRSSRPCQSILSEWPKSLGSRESSPSGETPFTNRASEAAHGSSIASTR